MRLHRALFYILLAIFIAGILLAVFVDPSKVMSRVATGLVTGAFVGLLSTVVNYAYAWQSYFRNLFEGAFELFQELEDELVHARATISTYESLDKQYLIDHAEPHTPEDFKTLEEMQHKFDKYRIKLDDAPYAPLFFSKKTVKALDELYGFVNGRLHMLFTYSALKDSLVCLQEGHFSCKEEEEIAIGNKDDFFDFIMQNMYNWRDYTGHCIRQLGDILVAVQQSLKPFDIGKDFKGIPKMLCDLAAMDLKDIPDRDPVEEGIKEMEEEEKDYMNNKT